MGRLTGNLVVSGDLYFGELTTAGAVISGITRHGEARSGEPLIIPGFIDLHFHGLGPYGTESLDSLRGIAEFAPRTGTTGICPAVSPDRWEKLLACVQNGAILAKSEPVGAHFLGTHLEGPFIAPEAKGGMNEQYLRAASISELEALLEAAEGTVRVLTLSPEIAGAMELIRLACSRDVQVSIGHTHCTLEQFSQAVSAGARQVCHLFDTFEGRTVQGGVSQPCLADAVLLDDRVFVEIIVDGHHVPPMLIELARRCAGAARIIAITDCTQGTGLPDGVYRKSDGREFRLTNGGVCRLTDGSNNIVGSCLTMDAAFRNLTGKFGFSIPEASLMLSGNPARALKAHDRTGELRVGLQADITVLAPGTHQVERCFVNGRCVFQSNQQQTAG
ncbi:MAG: amidohydrolase family protein [Oligosphaeraceae bacterium]|nr:amidohydrolase family protein [Oligosphaeraceae bacterium]